MTNPIVVDLSHWQADPIDWDDLFEAGTNGVILKATDGVSYVDPTFHDRCGEAMNAGLNVAAYHFLRHLDVDEQMHSFLTEVDRHKLGRVCIDYELPEDDASTEPDLSDLFNAVYYLKQFKALDIAVYGSGKLRADIGADYYHYLSNTSLWIAHYTDDAQPLWPSNQWPRWDLWQYSNACDVKGVNGPVDGNRWNADAGSLDYWFMQPPPLRENCVTLALDVPSHIEVQVFVNGVEYGQ